MILYYYYIEPIRKVRIKSEKLCLDITLDLLASDTPLTWNDCLTLINTGIFTSFKVYLTEDNNAYYIDSITNEKVSLIGWCDLIELNIQKVIRNK